MKGWTLEQVQALEQETYDELVAWINEIESAQHDSVDMDTVIAAQKQAKQDG